MPLYLDYAASAPLAAAARNAVNDMLATPGNPHARHHAFGAAAARAVETARAQVAAAIAAPASQVFFTSGATEANNMALLGLAPYLKAIGKTHIVSSPVEHKAVLAPLEILRGQGFDVTLVPPKPCGMIEADMVERALTPATGLVSIQAVNNELGTIQPLSEISAMLRGRGILLHSDGAQALGKIPVAVDALGVDFLNLSAHKMGGPGGIGALYARDPANISPLLHGGGQQDGLRPGTLPVALCAGFGAACAALEDDRALLQQMRSDMLKRLAPLAPVIYGHSDPDWNVPGILSMRFPGIDSETLVMALPGLAFGTGAACSSAGTTSYSHVIDSIEKDRRAAAEVIRLSWGGLTSMIELQDAADQIVAAVTEIRQLQEAA